MPDNPLPGRWELVSYALEDGSVPLGDQPSGTLLYTPDGYVSVHIAGTDRPRFGTRTAADGDAPHKVAAASTYIGYCGWYEWLGDRVAHRVTVSFFPDYVGAELVRAAELAGDRLTLRAYPAPVRAQRPTPVLVWRRVGPTPAGRPPDGAGQWV
ncbi:lipocalin-like domain-containing protein [Phytohabitans sp. ZYX-F-186]|uniref:Lipocalin-like domain-containing protein n=1 Tax=Phytohabitans maris TaxID=3071409 RepID=A0ABU0ZSZ4_9ACTN|nr:lipocalin-like domain-containing protein [Phytohabitans sp. ZYX-F-186]MDQ7910153.1 lipocalin-like domain-containing protein [Phytohabitans sp. ZYX-F-186]